MQKSSCLLTGFSNPVVSPEFALRAAGFGCQAFPRKLLNFLSGGKKRSKAHGLCPLCKGDGGWCLWSLGWIGNAAGRRCQAQSCYLEVGDPQELPVARAAHPCAGTPCMAGLAEDCSCVSCAFLAFWVACHDSRAWHQQHGWLCVQAWCHLQEGLQLVDALLGF